jgi:hypothetical protein
MIGPPGGQEMKTFLLNDYPIQLNALVVDEFSLGRVGADDKIAGSFVIEVDNETVLETFNDYYKDFAQREDDPNDLEDANESFASLRTTGYCELKDMIERYPGILSDVLLSIIPGEFVGYLFADLKSTSAPYLLKTIDSISVEKTLTKITGKAVFMVRDNLETASLTK